MRDEFREARAMKRRVKRSLWLILGTAGVALLNGIVALGVFALVASASFLFWSAIGTR